MTLLYRLGSKLQQSKTQKRPLKTDPNNTISTVAEEEKIAEVKQYLIDLSLQYQPSAEKRRKYTIDSSLSQWNQPENRPIPSKESEEEKKKSDIEMKTPKNDDLSSLEKQLIDTQIYPSSSSRFRGNWTEETQLQIKKQIQSKYLQVTPKQLRSFPTSIHRQHNHSIFIQQMQLTKKRRPNKIDISPFSSLKNSEPITHRLSQQREKSERLPRLQRRQPYYSKGKYKDLLEHKIAVKYSIPQDSTLCKDINRINQLIKSQNVTLVKLTHK